MNAISVLVVEDDASIRTMYETKLTLEGMKVVTANNGNDGLLKAKEVMPDIILLDLRMPELSGDKMLEKLRTTEWGSTIRVVILTNMSKSEAPSGLRFLSVDRYVVKAHTTPSQIVEIVKEVLTQ